MANQISAEKARGWWWVIAMSIFGIILGYGIIIELFRLPPPPKTAEILIPPIELLGPDNPAEHEAGEIRRLLATNKMFVPSSLDFGEVSVEFRGRDWKKMGTEDIVERRKITALTPIPPWAEKIWFYGPKGTKINFRPRDQKIADFKPLSQK